jgi:subtilisin family serine protease
VRVTSFLSALGAVCVGLPALGHAGWTGSIGGLELTRPLQIQAVSEGLIGRLASAGANAPAGYYVVHFYAVPTEKMLAKLAGIGVTLHEPISGNGYLSHLDAGSAAALLHTTGVRGLYPYQPLLKVAPSLVRQLDSPTLANPALRGDRITVGVEMFPEADATALADRLTRFGAEVRSNQATPVGSMMLVDLPAWQIAGLALTDGVKWIDRVSEPHLDNNVARVLIGADPAGARYAPSNALYGSGEVIAIVDTGLDTGLAGTVHPDLRGRIVNATAWANSTWADDEGHGTHVAGTAAGNGTQSGSNPGSHVYTNSYAGVAPDAGLSIQSVISSTGSLSGLNSFFNIMATAYNDGARVCNNSWGADTRGVYDYYARLADSFSYSNPDFLMVFAAGNAGVDVNRDGIIDFQSVGSPGVAKNVLTVGAGENNESGRSGAARYGRTYGYFGFPTFPISGDNIANTPNGLAAFSSRGPTRDNRMKPEIVAPGTAIISTRSSQPEAYYDKVVNQWYAFSSGTSMASPVVTGAAAIVHQYLKNIKSIAEPTSALMKAVMMVSARDLSPGQYGVGTKREIQPAPNNSEGFGRVDVAAATSTAMQILASDATVANRAYVDYTLNVPGGKPEMRTVLCWTDPLAASTANTQLVNNLDLTVYAPDGTRYIGRSTVNNWESLYWAFPKPGVWTFRVTGASVPAGPQHFSLVAFWRY